MAIAAQATGLHHHATVSRTCEPSQHELAVGTHQRPDFTRVENAVAVRVVKRTHTGEVATNHLAFETRRPRGRRRGRGCRRRGRGCRRRGRRSRRRRRRHRRPARGHHPNQPDRPDQRENCPLATQGGDTRRRTFHSSATLGCCTRLNRGRSLRRHRHLVIRRHLHTSLWQRFVGHVSRCRSARVLRRVAACASVITCRHARRNHALRGGYRQRQVRNRLHHSPIGAHGIAGRLGQGGRRRQGGQDLSSSRG